MRNTFAAVCAAAALSVILSTPAAAATDDADSLAIVRAAVLNVDEQHQPARNHVQQSCMRKHEQDQIDIAVFAPVFAQNGATFFLDSTADGVLEVLSAPEAVSATEPFLAGDDSDSDDGYNLSTLPRWAVAYTPYTNAGGCKERAEIMHDAEAIEAKGFSAVRLFSTDCDVLATIGRAAGASELKIIAGIHIAEDGVDTGSLDEQLADLTAFGAWDRVQMVVVGNEAVFDEHCTAAQLADALSRARKTLAAAGYTGPLTTVEPPATLRRFATTLCGHLDAIAAGAQPYFDGVRAADAGAYVSDVLTQLAAACPARQQTRSAYILETGWPRRGRHTGASAQQQAVAVAAILRAAGGRAVLATYADERWREPGVLGVDQFWGIGQLF